MLPTSVVLQKTAQSQQQVSSSSQYSHLGGYKVLKTAAPVQLQLPWTSQCSQLAWYERNQSRYSRIILDFTMLPSSLVEQTTGRQPTAFLCRKGHKTIHFIKTDRFAPFLAQEGKPQPFWAENGAKRFILSRSVDLRLSWGSNIHCFVPFQVATARRAGNRSTYASGRVRAYTS